MPKDGDRAAVVNVWSARSFIQAINVRAVCGGPGGLDGLDVEQHGATRPVGSGFRDVEVVAAQHDSVERRRCHHSALERRDEVSLQSLRRFS
jgi:hypothetical protein